MTTRHAGYLITLADDIREDDAEQIITALRMVKGVLKVSPVPHDYNTVIAQDRANSEWRQRLFKLLEETR